MYTVRVAFRKLRMRGDHGNFDIKGGPAKNSQCNQLTINREIILYFNPYDSQGGAQDIQGGFRPPPPPPK